MDAKLLVVVATGDKEKALTALMYAKNAAKNGWLDEVKVVFFGPSERLMVEDEDVSQEALEVAELCESLACKAISDREEISEAITKMGVRVEYVGRIISDYIRDGYVPMVW